MTKHIFLYVDVVIHIVITTAALSILMIEIYVSLF